MEEQFIQLRNVQGDFERARARFLNATEVSQRNRELVDRYLRDAALGKTVRGRAKRRIGPSRLWACLYHLSLLISVTQKNLDELTKEDMERFIEVLESGALTARPRFVWGRGRPAKPVLSTRYKVDVKVAVRQFYKWLWGGSKTYPEIVDWIDTYCPMKEIPALTEADVSAMIDGCSTPLQRALIQTLFDGGFRIGELLNVRLRHVRLVRFDPLDGSKVCFMVRVPFSKTLRRTVALAIPASTKWLQHWLQHHPAHPRLRRDGEIEADDVASPLFPITANGLRLALQRVGQRSLHRHVYPHLMRHTSATFWANRLPYFKFCKRFGWTMTSNMPQRYIDRAGVDETEVAQIYDRDEHARLQRETEALRAQLQAQSSASDRHARET